MKNKKTIIAISVLVAFALISPEILAAGSDAVFTKINDKGQNIIDGLKKIVVVVTTIVIIITGIMSYKGILATQHLIAIVIGSLIIGAAAELALFLTS